MLVKTRKVSELEAKPFTEIHFSELDKLIELINRSDGFYVPSEGEQLPFHSYQLCHSPDGAYVEIVIGNEG